jgi:hypothetical protein
MLRTALAALILLVGAAGSCVAKADTLLFQPENIHAWADVRAVSTTGERDWLDGGFGKLRYDHSQADLAQAAVLWTPRFADTVTAYVLVQDVPGAENDVGIEEAYLKWKPVPKSDLRYSVRLGQMFPPVSMEHDGVGWTPSRTLTPSAINSSIGEEVLVDGIEGSVHKANGGHTVGLTLGAFSRDDTAGTILSWRGWALHDISSADNTQLQLPEGDEQGWYRLFDDYQSEYSRPMSEVDHRTGWYARLDWRPPAPMALNLEFYDNLGDPNSVRNAQWGWATRFYNLGVQWNPAPGMEVLSLVMRGSTDTGWHLKSGYWAVDTDFDSAFVLMSRKFDSGSRVTGRIDYFNVKDHSLRAVDDNTDKGYALTLAWLKPVTAHLDLAVEGLQVTSTHPARATQDLAPRQSQTQLQVALKIHF